MALSTLRRHLKNHGSGKAGSKRVADWFVDLRERETLHNARKGYLRVLYPYHPYYGQTLEVFGAGGGLRDLAYVRMPNNTTRGIPGIFKLADIGRKIFSPDIE
jgi:hypothetical protein